MILAKKISLNEGEPPRKVEIPLRLSYFAPLREQKSAAADPKCCGTGSKENTPFARRKKRMSPRNAAGQAAKKGRRKDQDPFAALLLGAFA